MLLYIAYTLFLICFFSCWDIILILHVILGHDFSLINIIQWFHLLASSEEQGTQQEIEQ
jgi:hypothetical protein